MLRRSEFDILSAFVGEPVTWNHAKGIETATLIPFAIVQSTTKNNEALVNAFGVAGKAIQIGEGTTPIPPEKFDIFLLADGAKFVIDSVVEHRERGTGVIQHYTCYCKGR